MHSKWAAALLAAGLTIGLGATAGAAAPSATTDRTTAQHINLVGADMAGWTESPNPPDSSFNAANDKFELCIGAPNPPKVDSATAMSALFSKGNLQLTSNVTMFKTHAEAVADDNSIKSHHLQTCTAKYIGPALQLGFPKSLKVKNVRGVAYAAPAGLPVGNAVRLTASVVSTHGKQKTTVTLTEEDITFVIGRAEVTMTQSVIGSVPIPSQAGLLTILQQRAFLAAL